MVMDLAAQVHDVSAPIYLETKADLVRYYQMEHPNRWQRQLSEDLAPITGIGARSLARRFNPDRVGRPGSALEQLGYQELGQEIGPVEYKPPSGGYEITFVGEVRISRKCYPRAFTVTVTGDDAQSFANDPDIFDVFRSYFDGDDLAEGYCGDPQIEVRAA